MPNNSNARREKDKKKQSKKKKTDPSPLHKEGKASQDSISLSHVGTDRAANLSDPRYLESALLVEFQRSLTEDEKFDMHVEVKMANPGASSKELVAIIRAAMLKAALEARKKKSQDAKDVSLSSPLTGKDEASLDSSSLSPSLAGTDTTKDRSDSGYDGIKQSAPLFIGIHYFPHAGRKSGHAQ
jgi:hypothetical protein